MKQDTKSSIPLIVGSGRLARHWKHYLKLERLDYLEWSRHSLVPFGAFAADHAAQISCVYLLISDAALGSFFTEQLGVLTPSIPWFHASGALCIDGMIDAHPMMTFAETLYDVERYRSISFTTASPLKPVESVLLADLQNTISPISPENKALYHALCVLGVAGTGTLWILLEKEWHTLGVEPAAWKPYQAQIFANLTEQGRGAITGPWVRGDKFTTATNLAALGTASAKKLYEVLKGVFDEYREH